MAKTYKQFDDAREVRRETLRLVERLDQGQSEWKPAADRWSVGQVLDHLIKLDHLIVRELEVAINQRRRGLPFVYRSVADIDTAVPWVLRPVLPFVEVPFGIFNAVVPLALRNRFTGNRDIPLQAPGVINPRFGREIDTLRGELEETFDLLEQQQKDDPEIDLDSVYYYNPITGLNSVAALYKFVSNHEERHQKQLRELLDDGGFPPAAA